MTLLTNWAHRHGVTPQAMQELRALMGMDGTLAMMHPKRPDEGASESRVQSAVRLEASQKNVLMMRNNVGALMDDRGVPVRYGLMNESKAMNEQCKSSDLIGIRPVLITPAHVGHTIGQFVARECKHGAWKPGEDSKREGAQERFIRLVLSYGGDGAFASGVGTL